MFDYVFDVENCAVVLGYRCFVGYKGGPACPASSFQFAKVTCITVDRQLDVSDGVCNHCVFLCRDVIQ